MKIVDLLGGQAEYYLNHTCKTIDKQLIHIPGPDMIDKALYPLGYLSEYS